MTTLNAQTAGARLGPRELELLERIQRSGKAVVRLRRDADLFAGASANVLRLAMKRLADGGYLHRLERGTYVVAGFRRADTHTQLAIVADWLDGAPYVVTGFFALAHWNLTGHPPTAVDILLPRRKPNVRYGRTLFRFIYVPQSRLPESREVRVPGARALARVATPERALADALAGRHATSIDTANEAFERGLRDGTLLQRNLVRVARTAPTAAVRRLGWIATRHGDHQLADLIRPLVGAQGYVALDPKRSSAGAARNSEWRLFENAVEFA